MLSPRLSLQRVWLVLPTGLWQDGLLSLEEHKLLFNISSSDYLIPDKKHDFLDQFSASLSPKYMM